MFKNRNPETSGKFRRDWYQHEKIHVDSAVQQELNTSFDVLRRFTLQTLNEGQGSEY